MLHDRRVCRLLFVSLGMFMYVCEYECNGISVNDISVCVCVYVCMYVCVGLCEHKCLNVSFNVSVCSYVCDCVCL